MTDAEKLAIAEEILRACEGSTENIIMRDLVLDRRTGWHAYKIGEVGNPIAYAHSAVEAVCQARAILREEMDAKLGPACVALCREYQKLVASGLYGATTGPLCDWRKKLDATLKET